MRLRHILLLVACLLLTVPFLPEGADAEGKDPFKRPHLTGLELARVELGRRLFFDPAASPSGARSCASCHAPDHGWSDPGRVSADDVGDTRRHSQTILDAAFHANAHWDGEFASVEHLVVARLGNDPFTPSAGGYGGITPFTPRGRGRRGKTPVRPSPVTPGERRPPLAKAMIPQGVSQRVPLTLKNSGRYDEAFKAAFGTDAIDLTRIAQAVAAFVHTIEATPAPFDRHAAGDANALSASAKRGLALFEGRAGCNQCHTSTGERPFFTDFDFHNTGISHHQITTAEMDDDTEEALRVRLMRRALAANDALDTAKFQELLLELGDQGHGTHSSNAKHKRTFKTPTLRDVAKRGPYMHNGQFDTLEAVVKYYADGCGKDEQKSKKLKPFPCSEQDAKDLVAFLESLSGETRPGLATRAWPKRARKTRLTFVDSAGNRMKKMSVKLLPVGDILPHEKRASNDARELATDTKGQLRYAPGARTHMRIVLPEGLPVATGALVPDTCRNAVIRVPVAGRMTFVITFPPRSTPPETIVGVHASARPLPGHPRPRTLFTRVSNVVKKGETIAGNVATYEGWARTDVGSGVILQIPGRVRKDSGNGVPRHDRVWGVSAGALYKLDLSAE